MHQVSKVIHHQIDKVFLNEKIADYAKHAFAKNTLRAYNSDWKDFSNWCSASNVDPLQCDHNTLIYYITNLAEKGHKSSTIQRKLSGISKVCEMNSHEIKLTNNEFKLVWQGIRRKLGIAQKGKEPLLIKTLRIILEAIPSNTNMGIRDRALLSFGWASAMRRSEIVQLNWEDIKFVDEGIIITIKHSKTDKFGEGQKIAILYGRNKNTCPIINLKTWKDKSYQDELSPVFCAISKADNIKNQRLAAIDIARIIKKWIRHIGLDADGFAGHSLRSGLITTASKNSVPDYVIMKHSRHKSAKMIHLYTRDNSLINDNVTGMIGL